MENPNIKRSIYTTFYLKRFDEGELIYALYPKFSPPETTGDVKY